MKKVLIATTNNDKYDIVKRIFENTIFSKDEYVIESLKTLNINLEDKEETGSYEDRAKQKAISAKAELQEYNFDYIVGIDDAIIIKGNIEPNIKKYIQKILFENYIEENEEYSFIRAYCIIDKNNNMYTTSIEIPYIYKSNENAVIKENSYPLSYVAYPIGYSKPINELTNDEEINYCLKYSKEKLLNLNINSKKN